MRIKPLLLSTCAILSMVILFAASQGYTAEVKLAWDAATGDPAGYKLYYGQASRSYQGSIDVGSNTEYTLTGLADGQQYYFTATAYDAAGNESDYSNEVTTITSTGLVAAYKFDEGMGTTVADASGRGNHGTILGALWATHGRYGKALYFDGVNDWVTIPATSSLNLTTAMTLEAWVLAGKTLESWRSILVKEGTGNAPYYLYASSSKARGPAGGGFIGGSDQIVYGGTSLQPKTWTHLAVTFDGTTQRLYVNGVQLASQAQTGTIPVSTGAMRIGGNSIWGEYFNGRIDEVRVYDRALTASQIHTNMSAPIGSAASMNVAATGVSSVSPLGKSQPVRKTPVASFLDRKRSARSSAIQPRTSHKTFDAASQASDTARVEVGEVEVDRNWHHVEITKAFVNPVVIANSLSYRGAQPAGVTIRNVTSAGFEIRTQAWEDEDIDQVSETVGYMVIESGGHTLADGTFVEAGVVESDTMSSFGSVAFKQKFNVLPVVLTTAASVDDAVLLALKTRRITVEGFQFSLQPRTIDQTKQPKGTISYVAWEPSVGTIDDLSFEVTTTQQVSRRQFHTIPFDETFDNVPVLLADLQMSKGEDFLNICWANKQVDRVEVMIDAEYDHTGQSAESTEVVGYIVIR